MQVIIWPIRFLATGMRAGGIGYVNVLNSSTKMITNLFSHNDIFMSIYSLIPVSFRILVFFKCQNLSSSPRTPSPTYHPVFMLVLVMGMTMCLSFAEFPAVI